ncbi:MAG TPA: DUF1003 domain-containing protein [Candidatus Saccharimonadales bacterium]|nr:DUF1003 domain-containing protein [Candidatus Saccharimonadales bacterium]
MAINANKEIERLRATEDKISDSITAFAGTVQFVYIHSLWFGFWIVINLGIFGSAFVFDAFPFGLLTLIVSLEAIFLSTFVMISQNRQAAAAEIRSELDYKTNLQAEKEIDIIMRALQRMAEKQGVDFKDLEADLNTLRKEIKTSHSAQQHTGRQKRRQVSP